MFIEVFNNNGSQYIRLVEGKRVINSKGNLSIQKKVISYVGPLARFDDGQPDYVKRLKESFKNGCPIIPELQQYCNQKPLEEYNIKLVENDPECIGNPKLFSHKLIEKILEELGLITFYSKTKARTNIEFDLVGFFRLLVYGRILNPTSKIGTVRQNNEYFSPIVDNPYKYNIYDTLDFTYKFRESIIRKINSTLTEKFNRKTDIVYYDVTNFFFETEVPDKDEEGNVIGDRQFGVSKEERHLPIVQMGLFMDQNGIPISIETFPGNTLDHLTMIKACNNTINNLDLSRFIFVGDRGMCNYKNICHLLDHNNGYVISKSIKKSTDEDKKWIQDQTDYIEVSPNFKYKEQIVKRTVKDEYNKSRQIVEKVVVYWSKEFAEKEKAQHKSFIEFLKKLIETPQNFRITSLQYKTLKPFFKNEIEINKTGEILDTKDIKLLIDEDKINNFIGNMGYYQIVTSETKKDAIEIIEIYHGLSQIENQFRIMKSTLNTRPIFVRTHEHINAHLLICMIALIVTRIIQTKIVKYKNEVNPNNKSTNWEMGLSSERIQVALNKLTVDTFPGGYYRFNSLNDEDLSLILKAFKISIPTKLYKKQELNSLKQTIDFSM